MNCKYKGYVTTIRLVTHPYFLQYLRGRRLAIDVRDFDLQGFIRDKYRDMEIVKLVNPNQCYFYMSEGVYPLWNEPGHNNKIVYVFLKEPTLRLFRKWREHDEIWKEKHARN